MKLPSHGPEPCASANSAISAMIKKRVCAFYLVERDGFEPSKASPADLQSAPFSHSGISPYVQLPVDIMRLYSTLFLPVSDIYYSIAIS